MTMAMDSRRLGMALLGTWFLLFFITGFSISVFADHGSEHRNPVSTPGGGTLSVSPATVVDQGVVRYTYTPPGNFPDSYPSWERLTYRSGTLYYTQGYRPSDPFFYFFRPVRWGTFSFTPNRERCPRAPEGASTEVIQQFARNCDAMIGCNAGDRFCELKVTANRREGEDWRGAFWPNCRAEYYLGPYPETDGGGSQAQSRINLFLRNGFEGFDAQITNPLTLTSSGPMPNCDVPDPDPLPEPKFEYTCDNENGDRADVYIEPDQDVSGRVVFEADVYNLCDLYGGDFDFGDPGDPSFDGDCDPEFDFCGDESEACVEQSTVDWSFGDGNTYDFASVYDYVTNDYEQAGDYNVTATVQPFDETTQCTLSLKPPEVVVDIDVVDGVDLFINANGQQEARAAVEELVEVNLSVTTTEGFGVVENLDFELEIVLPPAEEDPSNTDDPSAGDSDQDGDTEQESEIKLSEYPLIFDDKLLQFSSLNETANPALPDSFGPEQEIYKGTYKLRAIKDGFTTLESLVKYTSLGEQLESSDTSSFRIGENVFDVEVTVTPDQFSAAETLVEDLGEDCKTYVEETAAAAGNDVPIKADCMEFHIDITNISSEPIQNVTISELGDFTRAMKSLTPGDVSIPLTEIKIIPPEGFGQTVPSLEAGAKIRYTILMAPFAGSPDLEVEPTVTGVYLGENVKGSGRDEFKISKDTVLKFGAKLRRPSIDESNAAYNSALQPFSGAPIRLDGYLQNFSETNWVTAAVIAVPTENAGRGGLFEEGSTATDGRIYKEAGDVAEKSCTEFAEKYLDDTPSFTQVYYLKPKDKDTETEKHDPTEIKLRGMLATVCSDVFSRAKVHYYVIASTIETSEDGEIIDTDDNKYATLEAFLESGAIAKRESELLERLEYDTSGDYKRDFSVPLKVNQYLPDEQDSCNYWSYGVDLACNFVAGVGSLLYGLGTLPGALLDATEFVAQRNLDYMGRFFHYSADTAADIWNSWYNDDPAAAQRLRTEYQILTSSLVRAAVITAEQEEQIVGRAFDNTAQAFEDFASSDYRTMARKTTYVLGENADALLGTKLVRTSVQSTGRALSKKIVPKAKYPVLPKKVAPPSTSLVEDVNKHLKGLEDTLDISKTDEIAQPWLADSKKDPSELFTSDNLPAGAKLSKKVASLVGVSENTLDLIEKICVKYKARCGFRSRGARAIAKIKSGFAYLKGQMVKQKNTNDTDIDYLGYPREAKDTVIMVEPPVDVADSLIYKLEVDPVDPTKVRFARDPKTGYRIVNKRWESDPAFTQQLNNWMLEAHGLTAPPGLAAVDDLIAQGIKVENIRGLDASMNKYLKVRERARLRTGEWHDYRSDSKFGRLEDIGKPLTDANGAPVLGPDGEPIIYKGGDFITNGLPLAFGFKEQGLSSAFDKLPYLSGERRPFRIVGDGAVFDSTGKRTSNIDDAVVYDIDESGAQRAVKVSETADGRKIYIPEMNGPNGFRSFTGDIDFLHILDESGAFIKNPFRRVAIYLELMNAVGMQHGESFSFFIESVRAKFLRAHTLNTDEAAETIVEISREGIHATYYAGETRYLLPENANGLKVVDADAATYFVPLSSKGVALRATDDAFKLAYQYAHALEVYTDFFEKVLPWSIAPLRVFFKNNELIEEGDVSETYLSPGADESDVIQVLDGDLVRLERGPQSVQSSSNIVFNENGDPRVLSANTVVPASRFVWTEIDVATAKGNNDSIDTLPVSVLTRDSEAGDSSFDIVGLAELGVPSSSPFFASGDVIVISPGRDNEEIAVIASVSPYTLEEPLRFDHAIGEIIAVLPSDLIVVDEDSDGDGIDDLDDNCPYVANPDQANSGGTSFGVVDTIGDVCQCGDVNDSGTVDNTDAVLIVRFSAGLPPGINTAKCDVNGDEICNDADADRIRAYLLDSSTQNLQQCSAAQPLSNTDSNEEFQSVDGVEDSQNLDDGEGPAGEELLDPQEFNVPMPWVGTLLLACMLLGAGARRYK